MADVKWIKIVTNIFDDEKIRYIETLPNGDETIVIWFRILCLAGKSNSSGLLMMTDKIAYTDEMLSSIFNRDIKSIQLALSIFNNLGMIEMIDNKIYLTNWDKHQSLEKLELKKEYDKEYQKKRRESLTLGNKEEIVRQSYDNRTTIVRLNNDNRILDKELDIEVDKDKELKKNIVGKNFVPPTIEQVSSYCLERKNRVDAETFVNFYESKGWVVGKSKMKDWKASVRTWEKSRNGKSDRQDILPAHESSEGITEQERAELFQSLNQLGKK